MAKDSNKLEVVLVSPLPPPEGGMQSWTRRYMEWSAPSDALAVRLVDTAAAGRRALNPNAGRSLADEIGRSRNILSSLNRALSLYQPDVVHLNSSCSKYGIFRDYLCAAAIKKKRLPLVVHCHCNVEDQIDKSRWGPYFLRRLVNLADLLLVLNETSQIYLKKVTGCESRRAANFIDEKFLIEKSKFISPEIKTVIYVGHVYEKKGINEILAAARLLPDINFVAAGPVSPQLSSVPFPANMKMLGPVDNQAVMELLDRADVFLFPTYSEGFSVALLEAMARGLPVIATPVGANRDMLEEHGGILVRVGSVEDIVNAVNDLAPVNRRKEMSHWNVKKVETTYTINNVMNDLMEVYREVNRQNPKVARPGDDHSVSSGNKPETSFFLKNRMDN